MPHSLVHAAWAARPILSCSSSVLGQKVVHRGGDIRGAGTMSAVSVGRSTGESGRVGQIERRRSVHSRRLLSAIALCGCLAGVVVVGSGTAQAAPSTVDGQFAGLGPIGQASDRSTSPSSDAAESPPPASALSPSTSPPPTPPPAATSPCAPPAPNDPPASNLNFTAGQTVPNMVIVPDRRQRPDLHLQLRRHRRRPRRRPRLVPHRQHLHRPQPRPPPRHPTRHAPPSTPFARHRTRSPPAAPTTSPSPDAAASPPTARSPSPSTSPPPTRPPPGYVTVCPSRRDRPTASNLNFTAGQTIPNMVIAPSAPTARSRIYNYTGTVDVIVDVLGWFPTGRRYTGLTPARLMDTRPGAPPSTATSPAPDPTARATPTNTQVTGRGGVPATGVAAVALNVTATNPTAPATSPSTPPAPTDRPPPTSTSPPDKPSPTWSSSPSAPTDRSPIYNNTGSVDVIVDVLGWFPTDTYTGLTPARQMDTRIPPPLPAAAIGAIRNLVVVRPTLHQMSGAIASPCGYATSPRHDEPRLPDPTAAAPVFDRRASPHGRSRTSARTTTRVLRSLRADVRRDGSHPVDHD